MQLVIFLDVVAAGENARAHFVANDVLRKDLIADLALVIFRHNSRLAQLVVQLVHILQLILLAHAVHLLDHVRFHVEVEVLALLHQQRLVDKIAKQVLLFVLDGHFNLRGRAVLAVLAHFVGHRCPRATQIGERDDLVVHARDDLLHHAFLFGSLSRLFLLRLGYWPFQG